MFLKRAVIFVSCMLIISLISLIFLDYFSDSSEAKHLMSTIDGTYNINRTMAKLLDLSFEYLMKAKKCSANVTIIQIVTSYAGDAVARSALRRAYPSKHLETFGIRRVFLLAALRGDSISEITQTALILESNRFHDLVQGSFYESYRNLTYKHLMGLKWAIANCPKSKYIIKMDDDIVVDMYQLLQLVGHFNNSKDSLQMAGYVLKNMKPQRLRANKWYVTQEEYPAVEYPTFLSGWLYLTTPTIVQRMLQFTHQTAFFWIDDVYVTGILTQWATISFHDISDYFTLHPEILECCMRDNLKCKYVAGPSGGDHQLQITYQKHAFKCYSNSCRPVQIGKSLENTCVAKRKPGLLGRGYSQLKVIKL